MNKKGFLLILSTAIISGFSIFINKYSVSVMNPYVFTWLKNSVVALLLIGIVLLMRDWKILREIRLKQWLLLILVGLVGGAIPFLLFFKGLQITTAAWGSLIHKTMFIYVIILAAIFLKEKISKNLLLAASFLFLGNILLTKLTTHNFNAGDALVFAAAIFWATENTLSKYLLKDLPARVVAASRMTFGSFFIFGFLTFTSQLPLIADLNLQQIGWTIITSVLLFGYVMTWYHGLKYVSVSAATVILLSGAGITTILSFLNNQTFALKEITGVTLTLFGLSYLWVVYCVSRKLEIKKFFKLRGQT